MIEALAELIEVVEATIQYAPPEDQEFLTLKLEKAKIYLQHFRAAMASDWPGAKAIKTRLKQVGEDEL